MQEQIEKTNLTPTEAAEYLRCSKSTLDKDRVYGRLGLPYSKIGRRVIYRKEDLDRFIESGKRTHTGGIGDGAE